MSVIPFRKPEVTELGYRPNAGKGVLDARRSLTFARELGDEESAAMLRQIVACKASKITEMQRLAELCDRYDDLYYPNKLTRGGADHHPNDPNLRKEGMVHLSLNVFPVYVDVPAALQAQTPIENILPANPDDETGKVVANHVERVYFSWKQKVDFDLKGHKAATAKALYGRTAAKVYWDEDNNYPTFTVIDQPRNLWLGYSDSDYCRLDWAIYAYKVTPMAVIEEFGLDVMPREYPGDATDNYAEKGWRYPVVAPFSENTNLSGPGETYERAQRDWLGYQDLGMIEVQDYWYRRPTGEVTKGKRTKMETWNAIIVGNYLLSNEAKPEYDGELPYVPVFNTYIPGLADGKPELYDVEQLLREKEERLADVATMIRKSVAGQMWQLVGDEAPDTPVEGLDPKPNKVSYPGAGNRIEKIEPWTPEFQANNYFDRIDREIADVSGLNDLLRGLAPSQVLSSGKAITALVANYEARITIRRELFYRWRAGIWDLSKKLWSHKESRLAPIFEMASRLEQKPPTLTPRDDLETAQMAIALLNAKVWSQIRAMDVADVEDPESEQQQIRQERTDAAMFPNEVTAQVGLMATMQQMGIQLPGMPPAPGQMGQPGQTMGQPTPEQMANMQRQQGVGGLNQPQLNGPGEQQPTPPEMMPGNMQQAALQQLLGSGGNIQNGPGYNAAAQTMINPQGQAQSRVLLQSPIGGSPPGGQGPGY